MLFTGGVGSLAFAADGGSSTPSSNDTSVTSTDGIKAINISEDADRATQQVRGTAYVDRANTIFVMNTDEGDEPLAGAVVYLQYMNGKGQVSPIFSAVTATDGSYHFNVQDSVTSKYGAPSFKLAGDPNFQIRTWIKNPDPSKYSVAMTGDTFKAAAFHKRLQRTVETWDFTVGVNVIIGQSMVLQERPNLDGWLAKPESDWTTAGTSDGQFPNTGDSGVIESSIWWEAQEAEGSMPYVYHQNPRRGDHAANGVKVVGSYVNDEVAQRFDDWKAANKGYTRSQFRDAQKQIVEAYEAETGVPGSAIAESVVATVKADGSYYLPFKGTYGASRTRMNQIAQVDNLVTADEWHTVATDFANNRAVFTGGLINAAKRRHINDDYMYVYPVVDSGYDVWMDMYQDNMFQSAEEWGGAIKFGKIDAYNYTIQDQNFAFLIADPLFDVLEYNSYDNLATPGTTVQTETKGLRPYTKYAIQWFKTDSTGTLVKVGDPNIQTSDATGALASDPITVPDTLNGRTTFTAMVFSVDPSDDSVIDGALYADSFDAVEDTDHDGDPDTTDPDNNNDGTPDDTTKTADFQHVTQGVKIDGVVVNSNGDNSDNGAELPAALRNIVVTLTAKSEMTYTNAAGESVTVPAGTVFTAGDASTWRGADGYPVVHNFGLADFPKGDYTVSISGSTPGYSIADDSQLKDGETIAIDGNTANLFIDFLKLEDTLADDNEPVYQDNNTVEQGGTITVPAPTFKDTETGEATTPEVKSYEQDGDITLPDGTKGAFPGTVTVNADGSITVVANDDATVGKYSVPVKVTYGDDSTDTVSVPVTVTEKKAEPTLADDNEPVYATDTTVAQGGNATVPAPTFKNSATGEASNPEVKSYEQDGDITLPDGTKGAFPGTVTVNADGSITVVANDDATVGDYSIPVKVTYADGSTDTVSVPVKVTEKTNTDGDGDGVPDKDDKCPATPEGAKVDENGCSVAPTIPDNGAPAISGKVGTAITPVEVTIDNPGKAEITGCTITGLPAGLTATFADGKCTISGTPTEEGTGNYTVTVSYKPADSATAGTTDPAQGSYTINPADSKDGDGDGVPDDSDKCANTPAGALVDENGCAVAPSVDTTLPDVTGTVNKPITPVEIEVKNPGKADITGCTVTGLPAGLTATYKDGKCVISGTPTEAVTDKPYTVVINYNEPDGDKSAKTTDPQTGKSTIGKADTTPTFDPNGTDDNGNPFVINPSADDPSQCSIAPYVVLPQDEGVVYTVKDSKGNVLTADADGHYTYAYGETVTVTAVPADGYQFSGEQTVTWTFKSMANAACLPAWNDTTTEPKTPVNVPNANDGTTVPDGSTVVVDGPGTAELNPDGSITVTPNDDAKPGDTITVTVKDPYGNDIDQVVVTITEPKTPGNPGEKPDWNDGTTKPGEPVTVPNNGGKVPDGTTVVVDGPGTAELNPDGSITVTPNDDAKPGDTITVTVKDKDGNVIDQFSVKITGPNTTVSTTKPHALASTGSDVATIAAVALMTLIAGLSSVIAIKRRRADQARS
ncbi:Rib/alpha-like domain-containing protein [Alloscardovia criceti]|uniref:Rib/alpha-like domain-containing protein n=1 Tax=Alloscardovia criceti TaxID=356828 RepID=UPI000365D452|nr:Rib/alpha-like domain-containing protein [Alloscardovia criceti]